MIHEAYEMPCKCRCGRCEDKVGQVLLLERSLCTGAKQELTRRRGIIQKEAKSEYDRRRYRKRKRAYLTVERREAA